LISSLQACSALTASTGELNLRHLPHWASKEPSESHRRGKEGKNDRLGDLPFTLSNPSSPLSVPATAVRFLIIAMT
jgi:hypothetical protein